MQLRDVSTRKKLIYIQLLTAIGVLILCFVGYLISDIYQYREVKLKNQIAVANVIATYSSSAILFQDPESAKEILDDLKSQPEIISGVVFLNNGQIFAEYHDPQETPYNFNRDMFIDKNYLFEENNLAVCVDIINGKSIIGFVCLRSELLIGKEILRQKFKISAIILIIGIGLAFIIANFLQKYISRPLLNLETFMKDISTSGNYHKRTKDTAKDEIGSLSRVFNNMLDQIEKKDQTLTDKNNLLNSILDNIGDGVIVSNMEGNVVIANPASKNILNDTLINSNITDVCKRLGIKDSKGVEFTNFQFPLRKSLNDKTIIKEELQLNSAHSKNNKWILCTSTPLKDKNQNQHGTVAIITDITRIKMINQELEEKIKIRTTELTNVNEDLTSEIEKRNQAENELEKRANELQRSNSDLQQFAYVASHDLQEPLRMISSFTQLLEKKYKNKLGEEADEFIHYIIDGATRMKVLIDDLLAFSRVTSRAKPFKDCDLNLVLENVKMNIKETLEPTKAKLIIKKTLPIIKADEIQMSQLFQNLITNGIKFIPEERTAEIIIDVNKKDKFWEFSVTDNGIGINKEFASKIFVIFQRLHDQKKYPGSGIGLSICKKIVERHGGKIWFESKEGIGTTFYFTIEENLNNT